MKHLVFVVLMLSALPSAADQYVSPHVRSDGAYVQGYYRSNPNATSLDNYSTRGNVNPYTGQAGTVQPREYSPPSFNTNAYPGFNQYRYGYGQQQ